jgi:hypothetical protein
VNVRGYNFKFSLSPCDITLQTMAHQALMIVSVSLSGFEVQQRRQQLRMCSGMIFFIISVGDP